MAKKVIIVTEVAPQVGTTESMRPKRIDLLFWTPKWAMQQLVVWNSACEVGWLVQSGPAQPYCLSAGS
jgi:hypothetical protein